MVVVRTYSNTEITIDVPLPNGTSTAVAIPENHFAFVPSGTVVNFAGNAYTVIHTSPSDAGTFIITQPSFFEPLKKPIDRTNTKSMNGARAYVYKITDVVAEHIGPVQFQTILLILKYITGGIPRENDESVLQLIKDRYNNYKVRSNNEKNEHYVNRVALPVEVAIPTIQFYGKKERPFISFVPLKK